MYRAMVDCATWGPLETSLVEWKLKSIDEVNSTVENLGNFLSGMETVRRAGGAAGVCPALETSLVEWKHVFGGEKLKHALTLETSLVEWKLGGLRETNPHLRALETSLVEWKHGNDSHPILPRLPLETSLVEWKHARVGIDEGSGQYPWKLP